MELKDYQIKALDQVRQYLEAMDKERKDGNMKHASLDAWENLGVRGNYIERQNGIGKDLPNFCLKLPTGARILYLPRMIRAEKILKKSML